MSIDKIPISVTPMEDLFNPNIKAEYDKDAGFIIVKDGKEKRKIPFLKTERYREVTWAPAGSLYRELKKKEETAFLFLYNKHLTYKHPSINFLPFNDSAVIAKHVQDRFGFDMSHIFDPKNMDERVVLTLKPVSSPCSIVKAAKKCERQNKEYMIYILGNTREDYYENSLQSATFITRNKRGFKVGLVRTFGCREKKEFELFLELLEKEKIKYRYDGMNGVIRKNYFMTKEPDSYALEKSMLLSPDDFAVALYALRHSVMDLKIEGGVAYATLDRYMYSSYLGSYINGFHCYITPYAFLYDLRKRENTIYEILWRALRSESEKWRDKHWAKNLYDYRITSIFWPSPYDENYIKNMLEYAEKLKERHGTIEADIGRHSERKIREYIEKGGISPEFTTKIELPSLEEAKRLAKGELGNREEKEAEHIVYNYGFLTLKTNNSGL